jgi:hypothetical protein
MQWGSRRALSHWRGHSGREAVLGIDSVRGDRGEARAEVAVAWRAEKKAAGEYYSGSRSESGMWDLQAAGGGTDRVTATASGDEARLGQATGATWRG